MTWPDKISVFHKLVRDPSIPESQLSFELLILSEAHQRPAARCYEDSVMYDYRVGRKMATMPLFILQQFGAICELQEENRRVWQQRVHDIDAGVRQLEVESWDREDAVEDMGSL